MISFPRSAWEWEASTLCVVKRKWRLLIQFVTRSVAAVCSHAERGNKNHGAWEREQFPPLSRCRAVAPLLFGGFELLLLYEALCQN
jgi:hypothetical protein